MSVTGKCARCRMADEAGSASLLVQADQAAVELALPHADPEGVHDVADMLAAAGLEAVARLLCRSVGVGEPTPCVCRPRESAPWEF